MRAVIFDTFGGPEVLRAGDRPIPEPGPGEVRIRVAGATVNPTDIGFRSGRQAAQTAGLEPPFTPGMELGGVVDAVGADAPWHVGDRVMAIVNPRRKLGGAQQELVVVPGRSVAHVPEGVSLEQAATLPMNGLTVQKALDMLALEPGQTLAVTGAAGAVGGYAVELGKAAGLRVIAVAGAGDGDLVKGFGADVVLTRGDDIVRRIRDTAPAGVDGLIDAAVIGAPVLGAIKDGGGLACVRAFEGETERGITVRQVRVGEYYENQEALEALGDLVAAGKLTLRVSETFPPERAGEAQQKMDRGGIRGRLVIVF